MTLRAATTTREGIEAVRTQLSELAGRTAFPDRALNRADPAELALAAPHDVYALGLDEVAAGATLDAAQKVGRRFLVLDGSRAIASAEVADRDALSGFQMNEGPYVEATASAIARAEEHPELADGDYEIRLLRIPALYFTGLWLKSDQDGTDRVIPLDPAPADIEPGDIHAPAELLATLAEHARRVRAFDDGGDSLPDAGKR
jgi:hypothetical protein